MTRRKKPQRSAPGEAPFDAVRQGYETLGPQAYYRQHGAAYRNPHETTIAELLRQVAVDWKLDLSRVLDLACGSGEVTLALRDLIPRDPLGTIEASDPFTQAAYRERTGSEAFDWPFQAIADGALEGRRYSLVVCSFALHLCEPSWLPRVVQALARTTDDLLILTPHKRPELKPEWGFLLADERLHDRVRARRYLTKTRRTD